MVIITRTSIIIIIKVKSRLRIIPLTMESGIHVFIESFLLDMICPSLAISVVSAIKNTIFDRFFSDRKNFMPK
jgi:hypothetical protein